MAATVAVFESTPETRAVASTSRARAARGCRSARRPSMASSRSNAPVRTSAALTTNRLPRNMTTSLPKPANSSSSGIRPATQRASGRSAAVSAAANHSGAKRTTAASSRASRTTTSPLIVMTVPLASVGAPQPARCRANGRRSSPRPWRRHLRRLAVQLGDDARVVLVDDAALELHGGGELARLDGERARKHGELPDALVARQRGVDLLHLRLEEGAEGRADRGLLGRLRRAPGSLEGGGQPLGVEGEQRGHEVAAVAQGHRLAHPRDRLELALEDLRRHVLAARGDQQLLDAVGDLQEALFVDGADVARVQPPLLVHRLARRRLL